MKKQKNVSVSFRCSQVLLVGTVDPGGANEFRSLGQIVSLDGIAGRGINHYQFVAFRELQTRCQFAYLQPVFIDRDDHRDPHLQQRYD